MANQNIVGLLSTAAEVAVRSAADNPQISITHSDVPAVASEIRDNIATSPSVQAISKAVEEATAPVSWYQSKEFMGALVVVITSIVGGAWGYSIKPEHQALLEQALPYVVTGIAGGFIALVRYFSRVKPLTK